MREPHETVDPELPESLRSDLRALWPDPGPVPREVDERVRALVLPRVLPPATPRRRFSPILLRGVAAAVAAGLVAIVWLSARERGEREAELVADLDGSGRVDIVDAYWLARRLEEPSAPEAHWDIDGNGTVDARDVDAVAAAAVRIDS